MRLSILLQKGRRHGPLGREKPDLAMAIICVLETRSYSESGASKISFPAVIGHRKWNYEGEAL